ncbi:hypothetical protein [Mesorhizobium sp. L-2-11]|uniref:hypothetical protein n=1 Tax=Mesorhizobium sp. L-2-11 TaxID=2744521 RepID=UPI001935483C|nr:hypothetical protein [Mesorhizobium sp. L-2-11]BCH16470.1 hypothetical protein MesoLjLa_33210 [Mesorhizobium sp. L-2-11]
MAILLRKGFDLPPLMFTMEEVEAITIEANLVHRIRDLKLQEAAESGRGYSSARGDRTA